jgi:hypothetical protein
VLRSDLGSRMPRKPSYDDWPFMKLFRLFSIVILAVLIASCAQGAAFVSSPTPTLETVQIKPTAQEILQTMPVPTDTPTATATSTATNTSTPTFTLVPSLTFTSTPAALFDKAQVTSVSSPNGVWSVALKVPGLKGIYDIVIDRLKFSCKTDARAPETLFCTGPSRPHIEEKIPLVFTDPSSGAEIYSGTTYIIQQAVPTETPAGYFSCPNRGKNVTCEVECRVYSGNPCLVATCSDDCGIYFSLHTCPGGVNDGICSVELEQQMRKQYGLPPLQ